MTVRSQSTIRRDIRRLEAILTEHEKAQPVFAALRPIVVERAAALDEAVRTFAAASIDGDRERSERDSATQRLAKWVRTWRPAVLAIVPGAATSIPVLPTAKGTPDEVVRIASDLVAYMKREPRAAALADAAISALGDALDVARTEVAEATLAVGQKAIAREALGAAASAANDVLVHGSAVVRAVFGAKSPQYKQFIGRDVSAPDDIDADEAAVAAG